MVRRETSSAKKWETQHALNQVSLHGTKNRKRGRRGGVPSNLFAPVYMSDYVPSIIQTRGPLPKISDDDERISLQDLT